MLREKQRVLLVAKRLGPYKVEAELGVGTAYISRMESNEKIVGRQNLKFFLHILDITDEEPLTLCQADKLYYLFKKEKLLKKHLLRFQRKSRRKNEPYPT